MERRFALRKAQLLAACQVDASMFDEVRDQLREFVKPFADLLPRSDQRTHTLQYVEGLLSNLKSKNAESIAYLHDLNRKAIQYFVGAASWDPEPIMEKLAQQIGKEFGESDGVLVIDPSAHEKKGHESVGVDRQWSGRLAKITNCQVGIYLGYVSRKGQALVDQRLYLSKNWVADMERRRKCGVPDEVVPQTRHEMALEMIDKRGCHLPHSWVTADDEIGHPSRFRRNLSDMGERYLMAVPSNVTIRDLEGRSPKGPGRHGQKKVRAFEQMRAWLKHRPAREWKRITVRKAEKGPIVVECMKRRVRAKNERRTPGPEELMFITRQLLGEKVKYDFYLSNATPDTPLAELARVANAEHRIEECFQRAKTETGMSDYEVRTWKGWHHHHALVFMAIWFLTLAAHRGKKGDARDDGAPGESLDRRAVA